MSAEPMLKMQENGLPAIPDSKKVSVKMAVTMNLIMYMFGTIVAVAIYLLATPVDGKYAVLSSLDLGWLYLALFLISVTKVFVSWHAMYHRHQACIMQPNMYGYKVMTKEGAAAMPYVLQEEEGGVGKANRAQRAIDNYMEYLPILVAHLLAAGFVYPMTCFVIACIVLVARIMYATAYTKDKKARSSGFALFFLASVVLEALVLVIGVVTVLKL
eukprot:CAMPEP_0178459268 /NCGR_PEP_ID=MMETSP0689_2-20121128/48031_1 /TAXON_ID=160604 /ORGANISM="Amphidinium massartii, Strain CS-259" /LENGTH=214 /DNA_ID=CAMNT_0020085717 /DNA_START=99 /DNA_END=743 /DNA_ORIENTATION=-